MIVLYLMVISLLQHQLNNYTNMDIKIVFHRPSLWEGLYIDGRLECEGHNIRLEDFLSAFNAKLEEGYIPQADLSFKYNSRDLGNEEGFDKDFQFPNNYDDINTTL